MAERILDKRLPIPPSKFRSSELDHIDLKIEYTVSLLAYLRVVHVTKLAKVSSLRKDDRLWMNFAQASQIIKMVSEQYQCVLSEHGRYIFDPSLEPHELEDKLMRQVVKGRKP